MNNKDFTGYKKLQFRIIILFFLSGSFYVKAQPPVIEGLSRISGTLNDNLTVFGSNFNSNPADLILYFNGVRATLSSSTNNSINALIPGNATTGNLLLINKANGLQATSAGIFFNSFGGSGFDLSLLSPETNFNESAELYQLALCDFNNDGKLDVAATKKSGSTDIDIFMNESTPGVISLSKLNKFTNSELDLQSVTSGIICADLDGDGLKDMIVTQAGNPADRIYLLKNISSGEDIKFSQSKTITLADSSVAVNVEVKDLDRDGKPDLIVSNAAAGYFSIFRNLSTIGNISFDPSALNLSVEGISSVAGLSVEDIDNDNYPDIIVAPSMEANLYVFVNSSVPGNISFNGSQEITLNAGINSVISADFNGDGLNDLAVSETTQNQVAILLNQTPKGSNTVNFSSPVNVATDGGPWGISMADIDGNGKPDLLVGLSAKNAIDLLLNSNTTGVASFTKSIIPTGLFTRYVIAGDMDGDAKPDLIYTSFDESSGTFNLSVIRNLNCFVPSIRPTGSHVLCIGDTLHLIANQGYNTEYRWDKDNSIIQDSTLNFIDVTQEGTYKVIAVNEDSSCQRVSNAVIVNAGSGNAPGIPVINNSGPFCAGNDVKLSTDAVSNATYQWTGPDSFISSDQNVTISAVSPEQAGIYTLTETVGGCTSKPVSTIVEVDDLPDFIISTDDPTTFCIGNDVTFQVNSLNGYAYQWLKDSVPAAGATSPSFKANEDGSYSVKVTSSLSTCSITSNSIAITSIAQPNAQFKLDGNLCTGVNLVITNNSTYENTQPVGFLWSYGDGTLGDTTENTVHSFLAPGNYLLKLVVMYKNGACQDSVIQNLAVNGSPVCTISQDPEAELCQGDSKVLSVDQAFDNYSWNIGDTTNSINVDSTGVYIVTVTDENSCQDTCSAEITFLPKPEVMASADQTQVIPGTKVHLTAEGALTYQWNHPELMDNSLSSTPIATVFDSTLFVVVGKNADGCIDSASVFISIPPGNDLNITPMKLFSPNGDGIDDEWIVKNIESYPESSLTIYNSNGRIVYQANPYKNDWKAVYQGRDLPEGVYYFIIKDEDKKPRTGSITLIR